MGSGKNRLNDTPLVAIVGETASGKSALALALAERLHGEVICADSSTVYRGFDIGSAKPTPMDRQRVPHHLLDVADPRIGFSAAVFQRLAYEAIEDILSRGKLPLLVGGSGLYIDGVLFGYDFLPSPSAGRRAELSAMILSELLQEVARLGLSIDGVDMRNKRRLIRLIETGGHQPGKRAPRSSTLVLGLRLSPDELRARVEARVEAMIRQGLEHEVRQLAGLYGWEVEPMKGVAYREWQDYLMGFLSLAEVRSHIIRDNIALAKKQRTWFRRNKSIHWLVTDDKIAESAELITTFLNT